MTNKAAGGTFNKTVELGGRFADEVPARSMSVNYYKRYRMEVDLREREFDDASLPVGYRLVGWHPKLLVDHAESKFYSFREEIDAEVFSCLGELTGCHRLMHEICQKEGFLPEATWLVAFASNATSPLEYCGTIQGIRATVRHGGIQNVGITPDHRGRGLGTAMIHAALRGFKQAGLAKAYLEVPPQNDRAVQLYKRLGFRRTKTLFKAVELAYT